VLCTWSNQNDGLGPVSWVNRPDDGENFRASIDFDMSRNVLRFRKSAAMPTELAVAAAEAVRGCCDEQGLNLSDIPIIIAAPPDRQYCAELAAKLGFPVERIVVATDERMHTASLVAALKSEIETVPPGTPVMLVAAGAGIVAGAAVYRVPAS
jgi:3-oxoacyl-[acyl-carrier-protein] synthase III